MEINFDLYSFNLTFSFLLSFVLYVCNFWVLLLGKVWGSSKLRSLNCSNETKLKMLVLVSKAYHNLTLNRVLNDLIPTLL